MTLDTAVDFHLNYGTATLAHVLRLLLFPSKILGHMEDIHQNRIHVVITETFFHFCLWTSEHNDLECYGLNTPHGRIQNNNKPAVKMILTVRHTITRDLSFMTIISKINMTILKLQWKKKALFLLNSHPSCIQMQSVFYAVPHCICAVTHL